ncbi:conserved hypothetical protein [Methanocaldococcus sp. FS406-22]|uniref:hypothetical protein n=1 Tax=Methanocaldococcus sp. (strain FS406-22) TaxID=644281 RepID=UPI0001BF5400|nr:hypothetical protein [Methanocaldococcus sp. FS406-22]ADC69432.1 conserved hypothetical protein [Methanocaldococcus sp. FS406-22]
MLDKLNYLFLFWRLIKEGSLKIALTNIFSLEVNRDYVVINVENIKLIKKIIDAVSFKSDDKEPKSFFDKIEDLTSLLNQISKIANILVKERKTFILKYKGEDVLIAGYDAKGGLFLKNIKIANKLLLIKMLNEFKN